jgi:protein-tyrosine kinase
MSRIHDALKKAEEERAVGTTPLVNPGLEEPLIPELAMPDIDSDVVREVGAASPLDFSPEPIPLSWEMIVARCAQRSWQPKNNMLFLGSKDHYAPGSEEFRRLRSRLYQLNKKGAVKTIMVGSALPGEGKTFVSANLAQMLARQHGRRVALIDCDLRNSRLHESLGTPGEPGLSDLLRGEADELSVFQRGAVENLVFIPGGTAALNPAELIGNGRLEDLLHRLARIFDWIIVDSPPAVPVSDASLIARICDGVLLVVHSARTPFDLAQRGKQEFPAARILGVVLNRAEATPAYGSYYAAYPNPEGAVQG